MIQALKATMICTSLLVFGSMTVGVDAAPIVSQNAKTNSVKIKNGRLELVIDTANGLNPKSMVDVKTKRAYADADYSWSGAKAPILYGKPAVSKKADGSYSVAFAAGRGALKLNVTYIVPANEPNTIIETVRISNTGDALLDTSGFYCGFSKKIGDKNSLTDSRVCNIPYRYHPETGELCDYTIQDLTTKKSWYSTSRNPFYDRKDSTIWGAEAWAWYKGNNTLLISKYNPDSLEWALLEPTGEGDAKVLRFGGAGRWKAGDPDRAASLKPGTSFTFGITRYQVLDGNWKNGYYAHRRFAQRMGHRLPKNYNPPVHWNELYDNPLWKDGTGDSGENREKYFRRADMKIEADKGKDLGCEALYLDPGWDTAFASGVWATSRLGEQTDFAKWLKDEYGFELALHAPLAPWADGNAFPAPNKIMVSPNGDHSNEACCSSKAYIDAKIERSKKVLHDGAYMLHYDGAWFATCWDPTHGHSVPQTHQEHLDSILKITQEVHKAYPKATIELHDPMTGPGTPRYTPLYFMLAKPYGVDEVWANEYMNTPIEDIANHRAFSLIYSCMAYDIPLYLHTDLRKDNANAIVFWWFASTCRHLGVGGKSTDPAIWAAQKAAMKTYLANKKFFTQGEFYGLDDTVHAHSLPGIGQCVLNCFNVMNEPMCKEFRFKLSDVGLKAKPVKIDGVTYRQNGDDVVLNLSIPALAHQFVKISYKR